MSAYIYVPIIIVVIILKIIFWTWRISVWRKRAVVVTRTRTVVVDRRPNPYGQQQNPYGRLDDRHVSVAPPSGQYNAHVGDPNYGAPPAMSSRPSGESGPPTYNQAMYDPAPAPHQDVKPVSTDPEKALVDF